MLSNSEFIVMLNQAATDRIELAKLLNISDRQLSYITNVDAGHGLIKVGSSLVPFENNFPKDTKLYSLMKSKPGEGFFQQNLKDEPKPGMTKREQAILEKIREIARTPEEYEKLVDKYLKPAEG